MVPPKNVTKEVVEERRAVKRLRNAARQDPGMVSQILVRLSDFGSLLACYLILFLTRAFSLELCYLGVVHYVSDLLMYMKIYHLDESCHYSLFFLRLDAVVVYHLGHISYVYICICFVHILNILLLVGISWSTAIV